MMREALLYQKLQGNRVQCNLCAHRCIIQPAKRGLCRVRVNKNGILYTKVYGRTIAQHIDPIEKKPLYHFYPGSKVYSIATPGCNFRCWFCQNWNISQFADDDLLNRGYEATPEHIVSNAKQTGCTSIAYTYTEPTIFFEYSYDTARIAHQAGLKNVYVSNGYMTPEMLDKMSPYLDAINIDLKAFKDETYRRIIGARLQPVLDSLEYVKKLGIWLEVTSLIIPGVNDDINEMQDMAQFIAKELGVDVPWHISRFSPAYKMQNVPPTPLSTLQKAKNLGHENGLHYVYVGNVQSSQDMNTLCPHCGELLVQRSFFGTKINHIKEGRCPRCNMEISGIGMSD